MLKWAEGGYTPMRSGRCRLVLRTTFAKCEPPRSSLRSLAHKRACSLVSLGYPKSQDGGSNLTQFLTFLLDFALDADTFMWLKFFGFFESEKAENPCYVWVFSLF